MNFHYSVGTFSANIPTQIIMVFWLRQTTQRKSKREKRKQIQINSRQSIGFTDERKQSVNRITSWFISFYIFIVKAFATKWSTESHCGQHSARAQIIIGCGDYRSSKFFRFFFWSFLLLLLHNCVFLPIFALCHK